MCFSGTKMQNRHLFAHFIMKNLAIDFWKKIAHTASSRRRAILAIKQHRFIFFCQKVTISLIEVRCVLCLARSNME